MYLDSFTFSDSNQISQTIIQMNRSENDPSLVELIDKLYAAFDRSQVDTASFQGITNQKGLELHD